MCKQLREMREGGATGGRAPLDRQGVVARVLGRVRLYLCPFAVCHGEAQGRGFVFVQVTPRVPGLQVEGRFSSSQDRSTMGLELQYVFRVF